MSLPTPEEGQLMLRKKKSVTFAWEFEHNPDRRLKYQRVLSI